MHAKRVYFLLYRTKEEFFIKETLEGLLIVHFPFNLRNDNNIQKFNIDYLWQFSTISFSSTVTCQQYFAYEK